MKDWISVVDRLPNHNQTVLAYTPKGQSVCIFVETEIMKAVLRSKGFYPPTNDSRPNYYFCSQEISGNILNNVTHWMHLPEPPK